MRGLLLLLLALPASARAPEAERLSWDVHYLGVSVGTASLSVEPTEDGGQSLLAEAHSADWFRSVYAMDDTLRSRRAPGGGSRRHEARYREGSWQHDLTLSLSTEAVKAHRRQRGPEGWRSWSDTYPGVAADVEDPLSVFQALRERPLEPGAALRLPVFEGSGVKWLAANVGEAEPCPGEWAARSCLPVELRVEGEEGKRGRVHLTDDAERLPLRLSLRTSTFSVRADLVTR